MKSQNTKSSLELKHEVREELKKVESSIDKLQGRMTPGQVLDDIIYYPNGASTRRTLEYLKNNPIGTSLLTMGTVLLMEDKGQRSLEERVKNKVEEGAKSIKEKASDPRVGEAKHKMQDMKQNFKSKVNDIRRGIAERLPEKETLEKMDSRQLLVLGAGLGAMTGASFPLSQRESEFLSDSEVNSGLGEFERELRDALNESSNIFKNLLVKEVGQFEINPF